MSYYEKTFSDLKLKTQSFEGQTCLWVGLNRPEARNALSLDMIESLVQVLEQGDQDPEIKVMVIYGEGECFSAGGDVKDMESREGMFAGDSNELRLNYVHGIQKIPRAIENLNTPLLAMINGPAIGAGADLASMCDLRVGFYNSKFGVTFSKLSLVSGDGGLFFLPRIVGYAKALEMSLTGDIYNGEECFKMGLLNTYAEKKEDLLPKTEKLINKILSNGPVSQSMIKRALKHSTKGDLNSCLDLMAAYQGIVQRTDDHFESLKAFREKRRPIFKGK
ncbi:MAG: enoyl-CoA hydratase-related protein [Bdellovibrionota bacterium]|nr:enoyl-CoA hydratase-related protein [Bdellovibrionota bacterium]|tara:strand:+ start:6058 stop:6888 length:831 start_codon:yes stop_codon:yes gene_type:complete